MTSAAAAAAATSGGRVVVVGVDDSCTAENAFLFYVTNVARAGDFVLFGHIPEHQDLVSSKVPGVDQLLREVNAKAKMLEQWYMEKLREIGISGKFHVGSGKPGEAIVKLARESDATLIVTGSRGQSKLRRAFLGSVSDHIIHHSHVPVLVYRGDDDKR